MASSMPGNFLPKFRYLYRFRSLSELPKCVSGVRSMGSLADGANKSVTFEDEDEFRVFEIPGSKPVERFRRQKGRKREVAPPRTLKMKTDQDWTNVWPAAHSFKYSAVPLPVRQGYIQNLGENEGIVPGKYANAELMKIPNFLHLTPAHIKKQCAAIKKYCTEWPEGLETDEDIRYHFPVEFTTSDYCFSGSSIRDPRARVVKLEVKLSDLELDYHARDKFIRLVGDKYNNETDTLTIITDRCPTRKQNYDYAMYLLTACYFEAWKTEPWEANKEEPDWEKYFWEKSSSCKNIVSLVQQVKQSTKNDKILPGVSDSASTPEDILNTDIVQNYGKAVSDLHNEGEDQFTLDKYKESVLKMFALKN